MNSDGRRINDQPTNHLVKHEQGVPEVYLSKHQVSRPLNRMEYIAFVSRTAMTLASDTHVYTVLKLLTTVQQAELLRQSCEPLTSEVKAAYERLTQQFMDLMEAIPQEVAANLMAELAKIPSDLRDDDLLAKLRGWLGL